MKVEIILALGLAGGSWLVVLSALTHRAEDFSDRIASQLRGAELRKNISAADYRSLSEGLYGGFTSMLEPVVDRLYRMAGRSSMDTVSLQKRLEQLGGSLSLVDYRVQQVLWSLTALALGLCMAVFGAVYGKVGVISGILLVLLATACGFLGRDYWLTQQIRKREKAMLAEFPALAELMALSVTAGESAIGSLERVVRCSQGELSREFQKILAMTRSGESLLTALQNFSQGTSISELSRFVDGLIVAIERGTPLADVLRAQAQDVRDNAKRELMETAGKKEIGMMAPVVFLILPLTVVFAMFPGLSLLNLNF